MYRYFENKGDLFGAVVQDAVAENLQMIEAAGNALTGSLQDLVPRLLLLASDQTRNYRAPALARMVIAESQAFPDLAKIWHDNVVSRVLSMLTTFIKQAQERGEIRSGDLQAHAFSIVGPTVAALIFREVRFLLGLTMNRQAMQQPGHYVGSTADLGLRQARAQEGLKLRRQRHWPAKHAFAHIAAATHQSRAQGQLASAATGTDYRAGGRIARALGIDGFTPDWLLVRHCSSAWLATRMPARGNDHPCYWLRLLYLSDCLPKYGLGNKG